MLNWAILVFNLTVPPRLYCIIWVYNSPIPYIVVLSVMLGIQIGAVTMMHWLFAFPYWEASINIPPQLKQEMGVEYSD